MRVLFTGNIDNIAYSCAKFTRWLGGEADVLVSTSEQEVSHPFWEDPEEVAAPIMQTLQPPPRVTDTAVIGRFAADTSRNMT